MAMPLVVVETGRLTQGTTPASVSNAVFPIERESIEVIPEPVSYSNAPESREKPPTKEEVAFPDPVVSILKIGGVVVANGLVVVAIVQA